MIGAPRWKGVDGRRRLLAVPLAVLVLLAPASAARAAGSPVNRQPTLLWQTYPLVQDPASPRYRVRTFAAGSERLLPLAGPTGNGAPSQGQLLLLLGSLAAALAGMLFLRSAMATASRAGNVGAAPADPLPEPPGPPPPRLRVVPPPAEEPDDCAPVSTMPQPAKAETCKVVLWHSHLKHQLYVASLAQDAGWRPLAVSPFFRLEHEDVPTDQASTALKMLVDQLGREGWTVVSEGKRWYDYTLARSRADSRR
jgi:hypothetical protein